ncbi:MAG: cytochrome c [Prosthecobacter sp.]|nr:cytochrome c [Prosthecobacter sp.]
MFAALKLFSYFGFTITEIEREETSMRFLSGVCGLVLAASVAAPAVAQMRDEDVIAYRQEIMKTMGAQATSIGMVLAGMIPDKLLHTHFEVLLQSVRQAKLAFEPNVPGGNALPAVWENHADFVKKLAESEAAIAKAIEISKKDGAGGQAGEAAIAALSCKGCHDTYKKP